MDFSKLKILKPVPDQELDEVFEHLGTVYPSQDPWGLNLKRARRSLRFIYPLYKNYFNVRVFGKENVQDTPYMVTGNHTGQIAIDGMLVSTAFAMDIKPPRILRSMVERFMTALPFVGTWSAEGGAVLGDRQNCLNLLKRKQSVLVFPEGVRGIAKNTSDFYKLQPFTHGFFRLSLASGVPVLPVVIIGAEEFYPWVYHPRPLAKLLKLPALPLTPHFVPLPSPVDIHILAPYPIPEDVSPDAPDRIISEHVLNIEKMIKDKIKEGLKMRREFFATQKGGQK